MAKNINPQMVGSLSNGVSQQSPAMRLTDQVEASLNARATIISGIGPRTGTQHLKTHGLGISSEGDYDQSLPIHFDRGPDGSFGVIVTASEVRVWNLDNGQECSVAYPSGRSWLSANPASKLRYCAAGDYLFMTNRSKTVAMTSAETAADVNEAFVYCRASNYEDITSITLTSGGTTLFWKAKAPKTTGGNGPLASLNVAYALQYILQFNGVPPGGNIDSNDTTTWSMQSNPGSTATSNGYVVSRRGSILRITRGDNAPFSLFVSDQDNAKKVYSIQKSCPKFGDLPAVFWPGAVIKVSSDSESNSLDYWVRYSETDASGNATTGYWAEVPAPGTPTTLDSSTMPWALKATGGSTFSFGPVNWNIREIGSEETIPAPSFVGQSIQDMFFVNGRLGFTVFDGCVTSRSADQPFNFWRESSLQILDTDPIDIISGGSESISFHSCTSAGDTPILFSGRSQYGLTVPTGEALSPRVAELTPISSYQAPSSCPPMEYGEVAYFASPGDSFVSIYMLDIVPDRQKIAARATNVSEHVPAYIKAPLTQIVGCPSENMIFVLGGALRREVFVYEFLDTGDKGRVQSAWSTWTFAATDSILGLFVRDRKLVCIIRRGTEISIETMDIGSDKLVGPLADLIIMDRQVRQDAVTITYDALDGGCYITMPYAVPADISSYFLVEVVPNSAGGLQPTGSYPFLRTSDTTIKVVRDVRSSSFIIGRAPRVYIEPSEQVARDQKGNPTFADASVAGVGPILSQTSGVTMRIGSKRRREYAKLMTIGDALRQDPVDHIDMFTPPANFGPGTGEYVYILRSEAEEKVPKRFYKAAGNANDVLVAFENNGPLSFRIAGIVYLLAIKGTYTGQ